MDASRLINAESHDEHKEGAMPEKLDPFKEHAAEYVASKSPTIVRVSPAKYLTIDGSGDPGGKHFQDCIGALYAIAFTIKMAKKYAGKDYHVCKLECLWTKIDGDQYQWKLMIRTPEFLKQNDVDTAVEVSLARGKHSLVEKVKLEQIREGVCVQALHVGPYAQEAETIRVMEEVAAGQGFRFEGWQHEIYLSDPRRVAPEKLRTILRHPLARTPYLGYE
jgi:hypothetical protein